VYAFGIAGALIGSLVPCGVHLPGPRGQLLGEVPGVVGVGGRFGFEGAAQLLNANINRTTFNCPGVGVQSYMLEVVLVGLCADLAVFDAGRQQHEGLVVSSRPDGRSRLQRPLHLLGELASMQALVVLHRFLCLQSRLLGPPPAGRLE